MNKLILFIKSFLNNYKEEAFFILKLLLSYFLIKGILGLLGEEAVPLDKRVLPNVSYYWEVFNNGVRWCLLNLTAMFYNALGFSSFVLHNYSVHVRNMGQVNIGNYCLGIQLWFYFAALIFSYNAGNFWNKIFFVLIGVLIINLLNVLRFVGLIFILKKYPQKVDFSHEYIFNYTIYVFSILMLVLWINRTSLKPTFVQREKS